MHRKLFAAATVLTSVVLVIGAWSRDAVWYNIHTVEPGSIIRSAQLGAERLKSLKADYGIRSIINLRGDNRGTTWYDTEKATAAELGIVHSDIKLNALALPPYDRLQKLLQLLEKSPRPLLLHCKRGADRTGLASAIALVLDGANDWTLVEDQFSWHYQVLASNSAGMQFFGAYRNWLRKNNVAHSKANFLRWVREDYQDDFQNINYYLDQINGQVWNEEEDNPEQLPEFAIDRKSAVTIDISGWGVDSKKQTLLSSVAVYIGGVPLRNVTYGLARPDVGTYLGNAGLSNSGWNARDDIGRFNEGCQDLTLRMVRIDGTSWLSPPRAKICIQ